MRFSSTELETQLEQVRELEGRLTFRLSVLSKMLDQQGQEILKDTPLNLTSYRVMLVVDTFGAISISDISRFTALDRAQISRTAEALGRSGLVEFSADRNSKRKKIVSLAEEGSKLLGRIKPRFAERDRRLAESLGPEIFEALQQGLVKLGATLSD